METMLVNLTDMLFIKKKKYSAEVIMRICIAESTSGCGNKAIYTIFWSYLNCFLYAVWFCATIYFFQVLFWWVCFLLVSYLSAEDHLS